MKKHRVFGVVCILLLLVTIGSVHAASEKYVVVNDKDWRTIFVSSVYATLTDAELLHFSNLADAQLKTRFMPVGSEILIIEEDNRPVVKNYESFLKVNGYTDYETIIVQDYVDAQNTLRNLLDDINGIFIFDGKYGFDPIASVAFLTSERYFPYFIPEDGDISEAVSLSRRYDTIAAGNFPLRDAAEFSGEVFVGPPYTTTAAVTQKSVATNDYTWGIVTRIDAIDLATLQQGSPMIIFAGNTYMEDTAKMVSDSGIVKFEVIGGVTAEVARDLETITGKDLDMLLKYGRRVTNYPGLGNAILDVDAVEFGYPIEDISVDSAVVYPEHNIVAITYTNKGNIDVGIFTSVEFDGQSQSDTQALAIGPGQTKTIGYTFDSFASTEGNVILTVQFGYSFPLRKLILNELGEPIVRLSTTQNDHPPAQQLTIEDVSLHTTDGLLFVTVASDSEQPYKAYAQVVVDDETIAGSDVKTLSQTGRIVIPVPYITNEALLDQTVTIMVHYGEDATIFSSSGDYLVEKQAVNPLTGFVTGEAGVISLSVLVVIIIIVLIIVVARRKSRKSVRKTVSSAPKKRTAKKSKKKTTKKQAKKTTKKTKKVAKKKSTTRKR